MDIFTCSSAPPDMRYSVELCDEENDFLQKRKHVVFEAVKKFLGNKGPKTIDEVEKSGFLLSVVKPKPK